MGTRTLASTKVSVSASATVKNALSKASGRVASVSVGVQKDLSMDNGIDAGQADRAWEYSGTLLSGTAIYLPLSTLAGFDVGAGAGNDGVGQAWDMLELVTIIITNENAVTTSGFLEIEPGPLTPLS